MVVTAVVEALAYLHEKTLTLTSQTSDNTNQSEKVLCSTKEENYQCTKPEGNKPNCFSKAKKKDSKGYTNERYRSSRNRLQNCPLKRTMLWQKHQVQKNRRQHPQRTLRPHAPKLTQNENMPRKW